MSSNVFIVTREDDWGADEIDSAWTDLQVAQDRAREALAQSVYGTAVRQCAVNSSAAPEVVTVLLTELGKERAGAAGQEQTP